MDCKAVKVFYLPKNFYWLGNLLQSKKAEIIRDIKRSKCDKTFYMTSLTQYGSKVWQFERCCFLWIAYFCSAKFAQTN